MTFPNETAPIGKTHNQTHPSKCDGIGPSGACGSRGRKRINAVALTLPSTHQPINASVDQRRGIARTTTPKTAPTHASVAREVRRLRRIVAAVMMDVALFLGKLSNASLI